MMKSDVLDGFDTIKACTAYKINGAETRDFPYNIDSDDIQPVYTEIPGWKTDMTAFKHESELPKTFKDYVSFLEHELEVPIVILSVGPDRQQTIVREGFGL
jgi:adenylosuccinate synthase